MDYPFPCNVCNTSDSITRAAEYGIISLSLSNKCNWLNFQITAFFFLSKFQNCFHFTVILVHSVCERFHQWAQGFFQVTFRSWVRCILHTSISYAWQYIPQVWVYLTICFFFTEIFFFMYVYIYNNNNNNKEDCVLPKIKFDQFISGE